MATLEDLAERVDRLVLRHQELKRASTLIEQQLVAVTAERDSLRSRLAAARARIDALLDRLPAEPVATARASVGRSKVRRSASCNVMRVAGCVLRVLARARSSRAGLMSTPVTRAPRRRSPRVRAGGAPKGLPTPVAARPWPVLEGLVGMFMNVVVVGVERAVFDPESAGEQRIAEVTHRREEHRDPRLRAPDLGRLVRDFRHPHRVVCRIESVERSGLQVELVAQHDDETAQAMRCRSRQAFLAQALHQPLAMTCLPANSGQPPAASPALPWYSAQLPQAWLATWLGYFLASALLESAT